MAPGITVATYACRNGLRVAGIELNLDWDGQQSDVLLREIFFLFSCGMQMQRKYLLEVHCPLTIEHSNCNKISWDKISLSKLTPFEQVTPENNSLIEITLWCGG